MANKFSLQPWSRLAGVRQAPDPPDWLENCSQAVRQRPDGGRGFLVGVASCDTWQTAPLDSSGPLGKN